MASLFGFDFELALTCVGGLFGTEALIERKTGELEILPFEGITLIPELMHVGHEFGCFFGWRFVCLNLDLL